MELQEELDIEAWAGIVDRFVKILADGVRRYGGTVDKFTGDGIMALFGAPEAQEDHARRACHAAWHMSRAIRTYAEELHQSDGVDLHVRIGLNSGEAVVGRGSSDLRLDPLGHTVGLAQRMEALAVAGSTYVTQHTARLVEGWFRLRDLGPMTVKGAREPLGVFVLEGPSPPRSASRTGSVSRLVGRSGEMAILEDALTRAAEGRAQVVGVVGEPGVGKSRLCEEFVRSALARGISVRRTSGVSHGREVPLLPILAFFRDYFGITDAISPSQARERISDRLLGLHSGFTDDLPLFFDFLEVPDPERPVAEMAADVRMRRIFEVLRRVTARRSEREMLVILLEDLHWFDPQSERFLEQLIENFPGSRTLVLTNFRPEFSAAWMRHAYYRQIPLLPLSSSAVAEMLGDLLGDDPTLAPLPDHLTERTGGNPFFVEEVVRALAEDGALEGRPGAYVLVRPLEKSALPASVQSVLAARIDRLSAQHKPVLQSAAVIGRTFAATVLAHAMGRAIEALGEALSVLCSAELLQETQRSPFLEYRFWHPLTQEVAYGTMLAARRARLHAAVAEALIELDSDHLDEQAAVLSWHWEQAGRYDEAARWSHRAAQFAVRSDLAEALRRWRSTLVLLERVEETPANLELRVRVHVHLLRNGAFAGMDPDEAERLEASSRGLAERLGDRRLLALLTFGPGTARMWRGDLNGALALFLDADRLAQESGDRDLRAVTAMAPAGLLVHLGPLAEELAWCDRCLAECAGDPQVGGDMLGFSAMVRALRFRAVALALMGRLDEAATELEQALRQARTRGELDTVCHALAFHPLLMWLRGDGGDALAAAAEAVHLGEETGNVGCLVTALDGLAVALRTTGRPADAVDAGRRALAEARDHRSGLFEEASVLSHLAMAHLAAGDLPRALSSAEEAVAVARARRAGVQECLALLARAQVARLSGRSLKAVGADLDEALQLVGEVGALTYEPFIREELGRLHADDGELREARRLYEAIGATGHARRLEAELVSAGVSAPTADVEADPR